MAHTQIIYNPDAHPEEIIYENILKITFCIILKDDKRKDTDVESKRFLENANNFHTLFAYSI